MNDFSYQKITTTASGCSLYWDLAEEPRGGCGMAAAYSISSVQEHRSSENNGAPFKCLLCWNKNPLVALQLLNAQRGWWLWMGNVPWTLCTNKAPLRLPSTPLLPRSPASPVANPPVHTAAWACHMQHGCPWTPSATLLENGEGSPKAQVSCHSVNNPVRAVFIYCLPSLNSIRLSCPGRKHWTVLLSRKLALDHRIQSHILY